MRNPSVKSVFVHSAHWLAGATVCWFQFFRQIWHFTAANVRHCFFSIKTHTPNQRCNLNIWVAIQVQQPVLYYTHGFCSCDKVGRKNCNYWIVFSLHHPSSPPVVRLMHSHLLRGRPQLNFQPSGSVYVQPNSTWSDPKSRKPWPWIRRLSNQPAPGIYIYILACLFWFRKITGVFSVCFFNICSSPSDPKALDVLPGTPLTLPLGGSPALGFGSPKLGIEITRPNFQLMFLVAQTKEKRWHVSSHICSRTTWLVRGTMNFQKLFVRLFPWTACHVVRR